MGEEKMKTSKHKTMVKLVVSFKNCHFLTYVKKEINIFICFLGAWLFLLIHVQFTPSERPKNFVN
jgi:hypothetical protein